MAEIVEVQAGNASAGGSRCPAGITAEVAAPQHSAERSGEDQGRRFLADVGVQVACIDADLVGRSAPDHGPIIPGLDCRTQDRRAQAWTATDQPDGGH